jgi:hypothetical protein
VVSTMEERRNIVKRRAVAGDWRASHLSSNGGRRFGETVHQCDHEIGEEAGVGGAHGVGEEANVGGGGQQICVIEVTCVV